MIEAMNNSSTSVDDLAHEISTEQAHVSVLYQRLDAMRATTDQALRRAIATGGSGTPAARAERDAFVALYNRRAGQLSAVEDRLCFGRLDLRPDVDGADNAPVDNAPGDKAPNDNMPAAHEEVGNAPADAAIANGRPRYIGRIGISDDDRVELLVDWRAPAAEPFYRATAAHPDGVVRRRSITIADRRVTSVSDDVLDLASFAAHGVGGSHVVAGEGALFASLEAARTGRMTDIVATIQADQDRVVRAPLAGVLVVQGGPGTGKTAVALHRAAYLLYAHRQHIERTGVLLVGPNRAFLRYIDQVLPTLGEAESVVMATPGELFAGVRATTDDEPGAAVIKGDPRMAAVIAEAVRQRQRRLPRGRPIAVGSATITLRPQDVATAREHARRTRKPHNQARADFVREVLRGLIRQLADARGVELDDEVRADMSAELREMPAVRREINWCWPPIGPARLLRDLYADPARLREAAGPLSPSEQAQLLRARTEPWTVSDVPLLDEAAELLGPDPTAPDAPSPAVVDDDAIADPLSPEAIADRLGGPPRALAPVAERAALDRDWAYGHVIVDEAQELSPMMWRLLMRRCPGKSMTVVGDIAQTSSAAGASSWGEVLSPHVADRWNQRELTVNYRTPGQIMAVAERVLKATGSDAAVPRSARESRWPVEVLAMSALADGLPGLVADVLGDFATGTVGVLGTAGSPSDPGSVAQLQTALAARMPAELTARAGSGAPRVTVSTVAGAKGLEFDVVIVVEPARIISSSPRGRNDLYVALTRATQRLLIVSSAPLPPELTGI